MTQPVWGPDTGLLAGAFQGQATWGHKGCRQRPAWMWRPPKGSEDKSLRGVTECAGR